MHFKTLVIAAGVIGGIAIGEMSSFSTEVAIAGMLLTLAQLILFFIGKRIAQQSLLSLFTALFCIGIFVGIVRVQMVEETSKYVCDSSCTFDARIVSTPDAKNDYQAVVVRPLNQSENILDVQLRVPLYPQYAIGETLSLSGKVSVPKNIPAHGNVNAFDYNAYLLTKNVGSEMLYPHVEVIDTNPHTLQEILGRWKENLVSKMSMYVTYPASSLASGMLFGANSLSKDLAQTFRSVGLSHIIVLSGFNIAIVISFVLFVFAFLPLVLRILLASISVILFVMMVGAEPSVVRATLMAFIALLATFLGREYVARQALIISFLVIILYEPYALLHDVSLHLSFLATAGIVYLNDPITSILEKYLSKNMLSLFATTLCAYIATLPYSMFMFGTVSVYALLSNIFVLPLVPVAMLLSSLVVVSAYVWSTLAFVVGGLDSYLISIVIWVAETIERLPFAYLTFQISFVTMCFLYAVCIGVVIHLLYKKENETFVTYEGGNLTDIISY